METPIRSAHQLGQLLAAARRKKCLSQRDVAKKLGVTQTWISQVERGHQFARLGQVLRLATWLGIEFTGSVPESRPPDSGSEYPDINKLV
jgi:transcriptional regulator with XRE-family HTH domain